MHAPPTVVALPVLLVVLAAACARAAPRAPSTGVATVALAAAADSAMPCSREAQVAEIHNPLKERAFVRITTAGGQVFPLDRPLAPDEVRRVKLPAAMRAVRADASSEPWRVAPRQRLTTAQQVRQDGSETARSQVSTRIPVRMACAT
ncbi:MAG: hypothetical protein ACXW05_19680 [Gemmatirosa sp.]